MYFSLIMDKHNSANYLLNYGENKERCVTVGDAEFPGWQAWNAGNCIVQVLVEIQFA
jgi:hypothetical protein